MNITTITIPLKDISDEASYHSVFAQALGFPESYERTPDGWVDAMLDLDKGSGTVHPGSMLVLRLPGFMRFSDRAIERYLDLVEGVELVNQERVDRGEQPYLALLPLFEDDA